MSDDDAQLCSDMIASMSARMSSLYPNFNGEYEQKEYPVEKDGTVVGTVTLGYYGPFYYNEEDVQFLHMLNHIFWVVGILFLLVAAALGYVMANRISRPIKKVIEQTKQLEEGNYQDRLSFHSNTKELNQLIHSVNTLAMNLERQQQSKKQLARNYAHEFRTPLATLQLNLEAMIDGIYEPTSEQLESCREEILRLTRMVADIDKIVKLENDTTALQKTTFDLAEVVHQTIMNFEPAMASKKISIEYKQTKCVCYADKDKITQMVVNLLSNAYKYTGDGGKITVMVQKDKAFAELMVADTGIGISKEELPYICEYLYRGDQSRDRKTGGTGIGLSVVKAIVEAHDGILQVNSEPGIGSEFTIRIPR
jgi:signal transduction histidine kinase